MTQRTWRECKSAGISLYKKAHFGEAERSFLEAVRRARDESTDPLEPAEALSDLASAYDCVAKFADATSVLREALTITARLETAESKLLRACCLNTQAGICLETEQYEQCESLLLKAIALIAPLNEPYTIGLTTNLMRLYQQGRRWQEKAQERLAELIEHKKKSHNITVFFDPVTSWFRPGRGWDAAEPSQMSPDHLKAWANLVEAYIFRETDTRCSTCLNEVVTLSKQHPDIPKNVSANALSMRGELLFKQANYAAAVDDMKDALRLAQENFGAEHPAVVHYMSQLACCGLMVESKESSAKMFEKIQAIVRTCFGEHHPLFARCLLALSTITGLLGEDGDIPNRQAALANQALMIARDFYDDNHSLVINARFLVASILLSNANYEELDSLLDQVEEDIQSAAESADLRVSLLDHRINMKTKQWEVSDVLALLAEQEKLIELQSDRGSGWRVRTLWEAANHHLNILNFTEGERLLWKAQELIEPGDETLKQMGIGLIAAHLIRTGKAEEAVHLLSKLDHNCNGHQAMGNYAKLAWALCACDKRDEAEKAALEIFAAAQNMLPSCLESLILALGILIDLYTKQDRLDDAQRILAALVEKQELTVATAGVVPYALKAVADAYAAKRSIKAKNLYEQAVGVAEKVSNRLPAALDECLKAYINYCSTNQIDGASRNCERLLELRRTVNGESGTEYVAALLLYSKVLIDKDTSRAEGLCLQALQILEGQTVPSQPIILETLKIRSKILKKLQRYQESLEVDERIAKLKGELKAV